MNKAVDALSWHQYKIWSETLEKFKSILQFILYFIFILKYNDRYLGIGIYIYKWVNVSKGVTCAGNEEIAYKINRSIMNLAFVNSYFDGNDFENPIKSYLDDSISDYLVDGFQKTVFGFIKENTVSTQDNIFSYSPNGDESSFLGKIFLKSLDCI